MKWLRHAFSLLPVGLAAMTLSLAQETSAPQTGCDTDAARQFDFWIGDWEVMENDRLAGHNRIEKVLEGCALLESWSGTGASRGHSLNFYDAAREHWHQTWIDNQGQPLYLEGGIAGNEMVLEGRRPGRDVSGAAVEEWHRITWTPKADATVRQHWQVSYDRGASFRTLFDGLYRPVGPRTDAR